MCGVHSPGYYFTVTETNKAESHGTLCDEAVDDAAVSRLGVEDDMFVVTHSET